MATAAIAVARHRIISHFMQANAVSPDHAIAFQPDRLVQCRQFGRMLDAGVIRDGAQGGYWLDIPRYDDWNRSRRRRVGAALAAVAGTTAAAFLFGGS